jgi:predicted ATP-grasp superfamily ATP-dependent carboligase
VLANGNPIFKDPETASKLLEEINRKYETTIKEKIEIDKKAEESLKEIHKLDLEDVKESAFSGSSESAVAIMTALIPIIKK